MAIGTAVTTAAVRHGEKAVSGPVVVYANRPRVEPTIVMPSELAAHAAEPAWGIILPRN